MAPGIVYLSLGSNVNPQTHIPAAIQLLKENFQVTGLSSVYETDPVGPAGNVKFWNLAAAVRSENNPALRTKLREIETRLGRARSADKFAPRTLDIDILPQADYQKMAFIMIPLAEIAPEERDPETDLSFLELAGRLKSQAEKFKKIQV